MEENKVSHLFEFMDLLNLLNIKETRYLSVCVSVCSKRSCLTDKALLYSETSYMSKNYLGEGHLLR